MIQGDGLSVDAVQATIGPVGHLLNVVGTHDNRGVNSWTFRGMAGPDAAGKRCMGS